LALAALALAALALAALALVVFAAYDSYPLSITISMARSRRDLFIDMVVNRYISKNDQ